MGRIAYLSKRGKIWWFRRRHPAILQNGRQHTEISGLCRPAGTTLQAKGHLAISLGTSSTREARTLAARITDHFERAWAAFEIRIYRMTDDISQDILDQLALTLTKGFRNYTAHYHKLGVASMSPELRERVFATLDAELRTSLGIAPLPYDDMFKKTTPAPISYIATELTEENTDPTHLKWLQDMGDEYGDVIAKETLISDHLDVSQSRLTDPDDEDSVAEISRIAEGLDFLVQEFVGTCNQQGNTPAEELPEAKVLAETLHAMALRLGLPAQTVKTRTTPAKPQYSDMKFSDFADSYLKLRSQGYTLSRLLK